MDSVIVSMLSIQDGDSVIHYIMSKLSRGRRRFVPDWSSWWWFAICLSMSFAESHPYRVHSHIRCYLKFICKPLRTIKVDHFESPTSSWMLSHSTAMFKFSRGPGPPNNSQVSPHPSPHKVACVFNTIHEISAASAEIIRRYHHDEVYLFAY